MTTPPVPPAELPESWSPCFRVVPAWHDPLALLAGVASPEDAADALRLAHATAGTTALADSYAELPYQDRLSGPGSGRIMASFVYPATPARFTDGTRGGTYFAARDLTTAIAETLHHFAEGVERSAAAGRTGSVSSDMQVIEALLLGVFHDLRPCRATHPELYDAADYGPSQRYGADIRRRDVDGIVYGSVRNPARGECAAVFRPRALRHATDGALLVYSWHGPGELEVTPAP